MDRALNPNCATRMIQNRVQLQIKLCDILDEQVKAVAFPADPDLSFSKPNISRAFELQKWHLFEMYRMYPDRNVLKYENLKLTSASKVYFCKVPTWLGGMRPLRRECQNAKSSARSFTSFLSSLRRTRWTISQCTH